jgi:uncharacterized repeat protein (TIGR01451 family)
VLPNNVVFVSASSGGTTNLGTVIWSVGALLSGGSTNLSFMVTAPLSGNVTNGSTVTASTTDLNLANNSSSLLVTTVTPVADIAVTSSGTNLVYAGGTVVYTVTVTNLGITSASNVIISDIFPTNATFFSASDSGSTNNGLVTWPVIPVMTNGQVVSFTITIFAPYSGTLTNTVLGLSPTFDPFTANNDGSAPAATTFTAVIPVADLGVGKSAPAVVFAAGSLAYTISVTNFGPSSADGVTVADIPPTGVTFASATGGGQIINNVAVWTFGTLTSGQVSNVTLTVMAPISGALTNVASAGSTTLDTNLNNNVSLPVVTLITNIPPIANPDTYIVAEDSTNTFIPLGNDTLQTPTGNLTIIGVTTTNGSISFTPTNVTFVPALNYVGNVTIGYTITDNVGGTNSSFIFVTFTNLAPTALPQTTAITENTSVGLTLTGNDPANKLLTFIIVNAPTNGSLTLVNTNTGAVTYLPNTNYVGLDSFTFRVNNGSYKSPTATVSIAVTNIAPVANPDGYTILENSTNTFSPLTNDLALTPGGLLAILNVTTTNGVATVSGTSIIFALTNNYTGPTTLSYTITDGIGGTNSSFITVHVLPVADVAVSKSGPGIVFAATNFNYTITVTNLGPGTATSLSVTDTLPTTVTLVSSTAGATLVACQLIWTNLGSLTSGTATNLTVTVTAPLASLSLTNVASGGSPTIDSNPTNNTSLPVFTSVTPIADVSVSKSGPAGIIFGTNFNYTITVTNAGPSVATTLSITDSLPAGLTFISSLPATTTNAINQVIWSNFGDLAPGTSTNLTLTVISTVRGSLTNLASGGGPILDLTPTNNFSPPVVTAVTNYPPLANPDSYTLSQNSSRIMFPLLNDVVRTPGGSLNLISVTSTNGNVTFNATNLTYTATNDYIGTTTIAYSIIDNVGGTNSSFITVTVTNITPIATPQAVTTFENTSLPIILTGTDPANHPLTFIITVAPTNGVLTLLNTNTGTLTYVPNTNYTGADSFAFRVNNGLVIGTNAIVAITVVPVADLLVAEFGPISGVAGSNLTYTVAITNLGPATVTNLIVTNQLPAGFTFVTNSGPGLFANGQVTWTIPILAANANTNFTFTVFAAEGGTYSNRAMGLSGTVDLNLTNNNGSASNALVRTAISALADVSVFKDGGTNVFAGQTVDYVITATNAGPSTATSVVVQDMLPAGAIFQNASGSYALSNGIVTWPGVTLAPNAATTFNVTLLAPASATSFLNVAQGNSPVADPNPTNNNGTISKARVTTKVVPSADVIVLLSAPATSILGSNFVYSLVVSNAGPSVSSNIVVSDSFPSNLVFVAASGGGSFTNSLVTWPKVVSLAVGSWTNYTVTAKGSNSGDFINIASALAATADPNPINNSGISPASQAETIVAPAQFNFLIGTPVFNPQTGLYEEAVTVTNTGVVTIAGFRLYVGGLRSGVSLYNANGTNNGLAFVQYNFALDPSNHVGLILEFYNPSRLAFTNTVTAEAILPPDTSTNGTNGSVLINRIFPDNRFVPARVVIEFGSVPGKNYTILYSTNLTSSVWKVATPTVTANANVTQWYDDGPPKTDSKPGGVRYYRIIKN